jgi:Na+/melibiose symporter and related transporters
VLSVAGVGLIAFGVIEGQGRGWTSPLVLGTLTTGAAASVGFVIAERRRRHPLIDMSLFARRPFVAAVLSGVTVFFAFVGAIVYFSIYFQQVQGRSAIVAGLNVGTIGIAYAFAATLAGRLVARFGERWLLTCGLLVGGIATLGLLRLGPDTGMDAIWWNFAILGVGVGLCGTPMSTLALSSVDVARAGMASAVLNSARQVGQVFGVAVLGALIYAGNSDTGAHPLGPADRVAFVNGLHNALLLCGIVLLATAIAILPLLFSRPRGHHRHSARRPDIA